MKHLLPSRAWPATKNSRDRECLVRSHRGVAVKDWVKLLSYISGDLEKLPPVLDWDECPARPVLHRKLAGFHKGPDTLYVALDADVAKNDQRRLNRYPLYRGNDGDNHRHTAFTGDPVLQQVDRLHVEIRRVEFTGDTELYLVALQIAKRPLNRLPHRAFDPTGQPQPPRSIRTPNFHTAEPHLALVVNARGIH